MSKTFPKDFVSRRLHSLMGLWLVLYIVEHLLTNSQAALLIGNDGGGFIRAVDAIHNLPYLPAIEIFLLGTPIFFHAWWGIRYIFTSKSNSWASNGKKPDLKRYGRNHAYSWQRMASWVLLIGIILHVVQMRFLQYPETVVLGGNERAYVVRVKLDEGLYTIASRMNIELFDQQRVSELAERVEKVKLPKASSKKKTFNPRLAEELDARQDAVLEREFVEALQAKPLKRGQVLAVTNQFGKATLLNVRNTFKDPWMMVLYTLFVISGVYHAFRGLWSFMIVWGLTLTQRSQRLMSKLAVGLMVVVGFLGLSAVWLTYWVNLRN